MKKKIFKFFGLGVIVLATGCASTTFQLQWKTKFDHNILSLSEANSEGTKVVGTSQKEVSVLDGTNGKVQWTGKYKEITQKLRKTDEHFAMWEANVLFVFDRKLGKDQTACIDIKTGKELWSTDKYQNISGESVTYFPDLDAFTISLEKSLVMIKARTGEEIWETDRFKGSVAKYVYLADKGQLVMINFKTSFFGALFKGFKNQLVCINVKNGDIIWEATYRGLIEKKVVTKEPVVSLWVGGDKVFLSLNGLQVYDLKTGKNVWSCAFDESPNVVSKPGKAQAFGAYETVADPMIVGNDVYVVDMQNKKNQYIRKYDLNTGKVLWTSDELKKVSIVPRLYEIEGSLILQIGGLANLQYIYTVKNSDGSTKTYYVSEYKWIKPFGIEGLDASTGKQLWRSEKFSGRVTNILAQDQKIYVASAKSLYSMNPKDGKVNWEIELKLDKVGKGFRLYDCNNNVIVASDKGVSAHKMSDGSKVYAKQFKTGGLFITKVNDYSLRKGDYLYMKNKKGVLGAWDMKSGDYKGQLITKGFDIQYTDKGDYIFRFGKNTAEKFKVY